MSKRQLSTSHYDIAGNGFGRVFRHNVLNRIIPFGNFRGGTGLKPGIVLLLLHWIGRPCFTILVRFEGQLNRVYRLLGRS